MLRELFIRGRRVIYAGYPESFLGTTTEAFAEAVEHSQDYKIHARFFKEVIKNLLGNSEISLWGYSAGAAIAAQMLNDHTFSDQVENAVLLSQGSQVDQSIWGLRKGVGKEIIRLLRHPHELLNISEVVDQKYNPFEDPNEVRRQRKLRKRISASLTDKTIKRMDIWQYMRVKNGGRIQIVNGRNDQIVKSSRMTDELLDLPNEQISIIDVVNGSHLTPLTKADQYVDFILNVTSSDSYQELLTK